MAAACARVISGLAWDERDHDTNDTFHGRGRQLLQQTRASGDGYISEGC